MPVEIRLPSHQVMNFDERTNGKKLRDELELIEGVRKKVQPVEYQRSMSRYYNRLLKNL